MMNSNETKSDQLASTVPDQVARGMGIGIQIFIYACLIFCIFKASLTYAGGGGTFMGNGGATEITQIANHIEMALQSVQSEIQSVELVEQTYLSRLQQMKASIGEYTAPFQKAYDTYSKVKDVHDKLVTMKSNFENMDAMIDARFREFSASTLSWESWAKREQTLIQAGNNAAKAKLETNQQILKSTEESMKAYQTSQQRLANSSGTHEATQILGAQLSVLGGDVNKLITITAQANAVSAIEKADANAERESIRSNLEAVLNAQRDINFKRRAEIDRILKGGRNANQ